ncbi:MAG: hypothetical protein ACRDMX_08610, partial [Solirubrobacteraceae bacterium]
GTSARPRRRAPLSRHEIQELEIAEPPAPRLASAKPAPWPGADPRENPPEASGTDDPAGQPTSRRS